MKFEPRQRSRGTPRSTSLARARPSQSPETIIGSLRRRQELRTEVIISKSSHVDSQRRERELTDPQQQPGDDNSTDNDAPYHMFSSSHSHVVPDNIIGIWSQGRAAFRMLREMHDLGCEFL